MSTKKKLIGHALTYASSQYICYFIGFFTSIFLRNFMGPFYMGVWAALQVVMSYASYSQMGIKRAVSYQVPMLVGAGKTDEVRSMQNIVVTFISIATFASSMLIAIYAVVFRGQLSPEMFFGLLGASLILLCERVYSVQVMLLRVNKQFDLLSRVMILEALANLSLVLLIVSRFKLYGFLFVAMALPILAAWYVSRRRSFPIHFEWNSKKVVEYLRFGFPIFLRDCLDQVLTSLDKVMIGWFLGLQSLGYFSIATMTRNYSEGLAKNFSHVLNPYFLEDYGKTGNAKESSKYFVKTTIVLSVVMSFVLGTAFFLSRPFVILALPQFIEGLPALQAYLLTIFFASLTAQPNTFLIAMKKQGQLTLLILALIVLNAILNFVLIKLGWGIFGVSLATSIVTAVHFLWMYWLALKAAENSAGVLSQLVPVIVPLGWVCALVAIVERFITIEPVVISAITKEIIFILGCLPLFYYLEKRSRIVSLSFQVLMEKIKR